MVKLQIKREGGRLYMFVNAKGLHETLDAIGVPVDSGNNMYKDRPVAGYTVSSSAFTLSTETLLKKEYPAKFDLSAVFSSQPPSLANLSKLRDSGYEQCRKILEHYQPIDISLDIQKKIVGPGEVKG